MPSDELKSILKKHKLRITDCRTDVLNLFIQKGSALSQGDLEHQLGAYERVTLYRTLNSFLQAGILHKIPNATGVATYGLCHHTCSPNDHNHNHIHFKCNACGQIECLEDKAVPQISVPKGYQIEVVNMIVDGICPSCA